MELDIRHVVLLAVGEIDGRPNGKTYLQKLCYFVQRLTGQPLGFRAHYYGPYSDQVSAELSFLTAMGLLTETRRGSGRAGEDGWEIARFDYALTDQGRRAVERIREEGGQQATTICDTIRRVLGAGDQNYIELSFAAKTDWILRAEHGPMTPAGIAGAAQRFKWHVKGTDVEKAAAFLENLGLVQVRGSAGAPGH